MSELFALRRNGTSTVDGNSPGDEFSNNLASDLAPLLSLFGETVAKQFLSQMTGWSDSIIFAMAPLGIITAVASAIRVGGPTWLKAIIGRAREHKADPELELMSSTSHEVCELWNGHQIVRIIGVPKAVCHYIYLSAPKPRSLEKNEVEDEDSKKELLGPMSGVFALEYAKREGIVVPEKEEEESEDEEQEAQCCPRLPPRRRKRLSRRLRSGMQHADRLVSDKGSQRVDTLPVKGDTEAAKPVNKEHAPPDAPNISLNLFDNVDRRELHLTAFIGFVLQSLVVIYALLSYQILPFRRILQDHVYGEFVPGFASVTMAFGTVVLSLGLILCSHVVEASTKETRYRRALEDPGQSHDPRLFPLQFWIQRGGTVNDQHFDSYVIISRNKHKSILFSKRYKPKFIHFTTVMGSSVTILGFFLQFTGIRGLHWTVAIAQLLASITMAVLRAFVRRNLAIHPFAKTLPKDHEMDWLATRLVSTNAQGRGTDSDDMFRRTLRRTMQLGGEGEGDREMLFWTESCYKWDLCEGGCGVKYSNSAAVPLNEEGNSQRRSGETSTTENTIKPTKREGKEGKKVSLQLKVLEQRKILLEQSTWDSPFLAAAQRLASSIEVVLNSPMFADSTLSEFEWSFGDTLEFTAKRGGKEGIWKADVLELEAAISLWIYSVRESEQEIVEKDKTPSYVRILEGSRSCCKARALRRDLQWWTMDKIGVVLELTVKSDGELRVPRHHIIGPINCSRNCQGSIEQTMVRFGAREIGGNFLDSKADKESRRDVYLGVKMESSLEIAYSQALFTKFLRDFANHKDTKRISGSGKPKSSSNGSEIAWDAIRLGSKALTDLVTTIQRTGLGSEEEIYLCVIPPLSHANKLPSASAVERMVNSAIKSAVLKRNFTKADTTLTQALRLASSFSSKDPIVKKLLALCLEYRRRFEINIQSNLFNRLKRSELERVLRHLDQAIESNMACHKDHGDIIKGLRRLLYYQGRLDYETSDSTAKRQSTGNDYIVDEEDLIESWMFGFVQGKESHQTSGKFISDVDAADPFRWTALHYAAAVEPKEELKPDKKSKEKAKRIQNKNIRHLLDWGASLEAQDLSGYTSLHYAIINSKARDGENPLLSNPVKILLDKGASISTRTAEGLYAIHIAAKHGKQSVISSLLQRGVDVNVEDTLSRTPLHWAAHGGDTETIKFLLKEGAKPDDFDFEDRLPIHFAALSGHPAACIALIDGMNGSHLSAKDTYGDTVLHLCARDEGLSEVIRYLSDKGINGEVLNNDGDLAIHVAAKHGNISAIREFREKLGIDYLRTQRHCERKDGFKELLAEKDKKGKTVLQFAVESGRVSLVEEMISWGLDICTPTDETGFTALAYVTDRTMFHCLKEHFESKGVDMREDDLGEALWTVAEKSSGQDEAAFKRTAEFLYELLNAGAHIAYRKRRYKGDKLIEETLLHQAAYMGSINLARFCLSCEPVSIHWDDRSGQNGRTPLFEAARRGNIELVKLLISKGADPRIFDHKGDTILHRLSRQNARDDVMEALLIGNGKDKRADIEAVDSEGRTCLMRAADTHESMQALKVMQFLVNNGAKVEATNARDGSMAIDYVVNVFGKRWPTKEKFEILLGEKFSTSKEAYTKAHSKGAVRKLVNRTGSMGTEEISMHMQQGGGLTVNIDLEEKKKLVRTSTGMNLSPYIRNGKRLSQASGVEMEYLRPSSRGE